MISRFLPPALFSLALIVGCAHEKPQEHGIKQRGIGAKQYQQDYDESNFPADDLGRPINLKLPAKRVVVIGSGAVETMFYLGAGTQLVGRDPFGTFPIAANKVAVAGDYQGPNIEKCLALRPDLVVVQGETSNRARFDEWQKKLGVPVAALTTTNFQNLAQDVRKLGVWVGKDKPASALAAKFEAPAPNFSVMHRALVQIGDTPDFIAGRGTLVAEAAKRAGFGNIADALGIDGYKKVNVESLLVHQPDAVIVPSKKSRAQVLSILRADAGMSKLDCVRKGRVLVVDDDLLLRPSPRLLVGVKQLQQQRFDK